MKKRRVIIIVLLLSMLLTLPAAAATRFDDVTPSAWYAGYIDEIMTDTPGVITGYGDGTFRPDQVVKRGEFLRMVSVAAQLYTDSPAPSEHWAAKYWQMCYENGILLLDSDQQSVVFGYSYEELERSISRYEMAVIIANAMQCYTIQEVRCKTDGAEECITDYAEIPVEYVDAVVQVYGKGIVRGITNTDGIEDGSFCGHWPLIRSEALAVIYYLLWSGKRQAAEFAIEKPVEAARLGQSEITTFAMRYRYMTDRERRLALFGDEEKPYFESMEDAKGYLVGVEVPVWRVDTTGNKYSDKVWLTVNKQVAEEVKLIFNEIYNDPERFPIKLVGCVRFREGEYSFHRSGCAIDINWEENSYGRMVNGEFIKLTGNGYWPGENIYSIKQNNSVVRAFAKYGWGWGGNGYSGGYYDFMHFSITHYGG